MSIREMTAMRISEHSASALLLSLWCVAVLSVTILAVARMVFADMGDEGIQNRRFDARELALTGIAYGMNSKIEQWDPLLDQRFSDGSHLKVKVTSEAARLDINRLLKERNQVTLRRLFDIWGVENRQAAIAADSLVDWTDADDLRSLNGAERQDLVKLPQYSMPANRDFRSVTEMEKVRGMDLVAAAKPDWAKSFTVRGGRRVDLQEAPLDVMQAVAGISLEQATQIDQVRKGPDRIARTMDDYKIKDIGQFLMQVGLTDAQRKVAIAKFSAGTGPTRIESKATVGGTDYTITAVTSGSMNGGGGEASLLDWDEQ